MSVPKEKLTSLELLRMWEELLRTGPHEGSPWRHLKTGSTYVVLALCLREVDSLPLVIYRRQGTETAVWWSRPLAEFVMKFEPVEE